MLQILRELAKSWVFKTLMALLILSFGIWGIGDMFRGNPATRSVAQVGKINIPVQTLEYRFQRGLPEARDVFGPDLTAEKARKYGVLERTLNVMIEELAYDQDAARLGINVNKSYTLHKLSKEPQLRDKDGKFNAQLWQQVLRQNGLTEQGFLDIEGQNTTRQIILSALIADKTIPETMIDNLYLARGDKRILEIVTLRNDSLNLETSTPSDKNLEEYYAAHENDFVAPEYRGITVAQLSTKTIIDDVKISDEDVEQAYQARTEELARPEQRDLVQIVLQNEEKAKTLYKAAKAAKSLSQAAKAHGLTPIDMKKLDETNVLPELYTTVFALADGEISPPIKSSLGWHVIQLKKIHQGGVPLLDVVKEDLRKTLKEERAGDLIAKTVNQLDDLLAGGASLEDVADDLKLHLTRFPAVDAKGFRPDGNEEKELPEKGLTLPPAFELGSGETGQVLENGTGSYYVVHIDQITPSQALPFSQVKDKVKAAWMIEQQTTKAITAAEELAKALRKGKSATSYASSPGMSVRLSKPISLLGNIDPQIPQSAMNQIFSMEKGDVITSADAGKQYVLRLADIVPVNPKKPEASRIKVAQYLKEKLRHNIVNEYTAFLHQSFPVSINQGILTDLKNRGDGNE